MKSKKAQTSKGLWIALAWAAGLVLLGIVIYFIVTRGDDMVRIAKNMFRGLYG